MYQIPVPAGLVAVCRGRGLLIRDASLYRAFLVGQRRFTCDRRITLTSILSLKGEEAGGPTALDGRFVGMLSSLNVTVAARLTRSFPMRDPVSPTGDDKSTAPLWLTVSEASKFLLVSPSTLRRWTEKRLIPAQRTAGGHRRYSREVIEGLAHNAGVAGDPGAPATSAAPPPSEWGVSQRQVKAERWYSTIAQAENLAHLRTLGQRLLGLLVQHISRPRGDQRILGEARSVGVLYGRECASSGASLQETLDAFLFFRKSFSRTVPQVPETTRASDAGEIMRLTHLTDTFMDEVLSGIAEGYESDSAHHAAGAEAPVEAR